MWAAANPVKVVTRDGGIDDMQSLYPQVLNLIERLHRRLLDVIKDEFDRRGRTDINAVQALLLFNLGGREVMVGELYTRGYYLGSNVSHSLKKLIELGLLDQRRSRSDRRSMRVKLTERGQAVHDIIARLYDKHVRTIEPVGGISADELLRLNKALQELEHFWSDQILYQL